VQVCWFDFDKWPPQNLRKDIAMSTFFDDPALVGLSRQWSLLEVQDTSCEWDLNFDRLIHIWGASFLDLGSGLMEALEGTLFIKLTLIFAIICLANYLPGACLKLVGKVICWWRRRSIPIECFCVFDCTPNCLMVKLYSSIWMKENVHTVVGSSSSN
jgi:hypothetical protein